MYMYLYITVNMASFTKYYNIWPLSNWLYRGHMLHGHVFTEVWIPEQTVWCYAILGGDLTYGYGILKREIEDWWLLEIKCCAEVIGGG